MRVHPATGWKALWVNRAMTDRIVGFDKAESDVLLGYLFDVIEKNVDIQVRFKWSPRTSALWDNRLDCLSFNHGYAQKLTNDTELLSTMPAGITKVLSPGMVPESPRLQRSHSLIPTRQQEERA